MKSDLTYDLIIIGGGISACVFASKYINNNTTSKIALIEFGRGLGGRSSTRISRRFRGWKLNHGAPNFNISNSKNNFFLKSYIDELLENNFIKVDDSELLFLDEQSNLKTTGKSEFSSGVNYLSLFSMSQLSQKIIELNNLSREIDFYFETLIIDLKFNNDKWTLTSKNGEVFTSNFLVCSSIYSSIKRKNKNCNIDIVCSNSNFEYVKSFNFFNNVYLYPSNLFNKFIFYFKLNRYDEILVLDGKKRSIYFSILNKSKSKIMYTPSKFIKNIFHFFFDRIFLIDYKIPKIKLIKESLSFLNYDFVDSDLYFL